MSAIETAKKAHLAACQPKSNVSQVSSDIFTGIAAGAASVVLNFAREPWFNADTMKTLATTLKLEGFDVELSENEILYDGTTAAYQLIVSGWI